MGRLKQKIEQHLIEQEKLQSEFVAPVVPVFGGGIVGIVGNILMIATIIFGILWAAEGTIHGNKSISIKEQLANIASKIKYIITNVVTGKEHSFIKSGLEKLKANSAYMDNIKIVTSLFPKDLEERKAAAKKAKAIMYKILSPEEKQVYDKIYSHIEKEQTL